MHTFTKICLSVLEATTTSARRKRKTYKDYPNLALPLFALSKLKQQQQLLAKRNKHQAAALWLLK
jgi:hypothetical protein